MTDECQQDVRSEFRMTSPPGPRTQQGKENSKHNALKHGIFSQVVLLRREPRAEFDAMAAGRCVIASRVGGNPELVRNRETGLLVTPEDEGALENALETVLASPDVAREWGEKRSTDCPSEFYS